MKDRPFQGFLIVMVLLFALMVYFAWDMEQVHQGESKIQVGESVGPYKFKGIITSKGTDTIVIEYDETEHYYQSRMWIELDPDWSIYIRFQGWGYVIIQYGDTP